MTKNRQTVGINEFVLRQIEGSGKTFLKNLSFQELAKYAEKVLTEHPKLIKPGYRDGVLLIECDKFMNKFFFSSMVSINEKTRLEAKVEKRREGEETYIQIRALNGELLPTARADLILYRHDVLSENNEQSTDCDWELIAFHAVPDGLKDLPMGPITMMRNQLELPGGTAAYYSSEKWAESVNFWQKYTFKKVK